MSLLLSPLSPHLWKYSMVSASIILTCSLKCAMLRPLFNIFFCSRKIWNTLRKFLLQLIWYSWNMQWFNLLAKTFLDLISFINYLFFICKYGFINKCDLISLIDSQGLAHHRLLLCQKQELSVWSRRPQRSGLHSCCWTSVRLLHCPAGMWMFSPPWWNWTQVHTVWGPQEIQDNINCKVQVSLLFFLLCVNYWTILACQTLKKILLLFIC